MPRDQNMVDNNEGTGGSYPTDTNDGLNSGNGSNFEVDNELLNYILFWVIVIGLMVMAGRNWETIIDWLRRLIS